MKEFRVRNTLMFLLVYALILLYVMFGKFPLNLISNFGSIKFIYSEKATKFCEISTADLTVTTKDISTVEISQNFVAFSEYMNFKVRVF